MKIVVFLCVLIAVCGLINCKPQKEKTCTVPGSHETIKVGEKASIPGKCTEITCEKDGSISGLTCPLQAQKGCKLSKINYAKPYPACCPTLIC